MLWRLVKTVIFTILVPGTVGLVVPHLLERNSFDIDIDLVAISGLTLFVFGVVAYLWCAWDFVSKGLGTPLPIDAPRVLVVKGLYRFTRNPMYVAVLAVIFGQAMVFKSRSVLGYGCVVLVLFHLFVRLYEEPALTRLFGSQYEEYCRKVPRWIFRLQRA